MTRIDFYLLSTRDPQSRRLMACRLIEKAYRQGHRLWVRTETAEETRELDDLLWTFRQGSFVPHECAAEINEAPVLIGHGPPRPELADVLVNLGAGVPPGFEHFERVAELVDQAAAVKQAGRQRYRHYQAGDHPIHTHELDRLAG